LNKKKKKKRKAKRKTKLSYDLEKQSYYNRRNMIRAGFTNYHHLDPFGESDNSNLLRLDALRHFYWHKLFMRLTLDEVIDLLIRLREFKRRLND